MRRWGMKSWTGGGVEEYTAQHGHAAQPVQYRFIRITNDGHPGPMLLLDYNTYFQ